MWKGRTVSVVLPTYNEKESIRDSIREFENTGYVDEIIVVNNNAAAGTSAEVVQTTAREVCEPRQGYGYACQRGLLEARGDYIVLSEPDGTFRGADVLKLLAYTDDADLVLGSRTAKGFIWKDANMGFFLRWGNWTVAKLMEFLFNATNLTDVGCTMRLIHREALENIRDEFTIGGSHFGPQMMLLALTHGLRVVQIPVNYQRRVGKSMATGSIVKAIIIGVQMIGLVLGHRWQTWVGTTSSKEEDDSRQSSSGQKVVERLAFPLVMLIAAMLLLFDLGGRALWWDEIINVLIDRQDVMSIMANLSAALPGPNTRLYIDVHPPVFHLLQHFWIGLAGSSDFAVRLPNVIFSFVALYLLYRLGLILDGKKVAIWAVLFAGLSPFWLLYARMARYYALTTMLGVASTLLYLSLLQRSTRSKWIAYFVVNTVMIYTDYLVGALLFCQLLYLIWARPGPQWLVKWTGAMVLLGIAYLPWLPAWHAQSAWMGTVITADLAYSPIGTALKFVFPLLSFTVGETIFPWEVPAIVGYIVFAGLLIRGIVYFARHSTPIDWPGARLPFILLFTIIPTVGTIAVITFVTPAIPFIGIGNRTFFAFPFVALLVASGLNTLKSLTVRITVAILLIWIFGYAIRNYYAGEHFFNPIYAVPTEAAVADVLEQARPGDAVFSDLDTGFAYYFEQQSVRDVTHYYADSPTGTAVIEEIASDITAHRPPRHKRLFILIFGRDRTRRDLPAAFTQIIQPAARLIWERGYTPQDESYRQVKQWLLGREDYRFKLLVQQYELSP